MSEHDAGSASRTTLAGPVGWVVAAHGLSSLAFFAFYGVVFVQAANDHDAGPGQTAILGAAGVRVARRAPTETAVDDPSA